MSRIHNFSDSLELSEYFEEEVMKFFKKNISNDIKDVRYIEEFQKKDIDFIDNASGIKYEIKSDTQGHETNNLAYEHISRKVGTTVVGKGCFAKTEADIIIYTFTETGKTLFIDIKKLRQTVAMNFVLGEYVTSEIYNELNNSVVKGEVILVDIDTISDCIKDTVFLDFKQKPKNISIIMPDDTEQKSLKSFLTN